MIFACLMALAAASCSVDGVYYQQSGRLHLNGHEIEVDYEGVEYGLYNGTVSSSGELVCGTLLSEDLIPQLTTEQSLSWHGDPLQIDTSRYVVYSIEGDSIVLDTALIEQLPIGTFSDNERYLLINGLQPWVVDLQNRSVVHQYVSEHVHAFDWLGDDLYTLSGTIDGLSVRKLTSSTGQCIDFAHDDCDSAEYRHTRISQLYVLDSCTVAYAWGTAQSTVITALTRDNVIWSHTLPDFHAGACRYGMTFFGQWSSVDDWKFFTLDSSAQRFQPGLTLAKMNADISKPISGGFGFAVWPSGDILFYPGRLERSDQHLYKYKEETEQIVRITSEGFVNGPIGVVDSGRD